MIALNRFLGEYNFLIRLTYFTGSGLIPYSSRNKKRPNSPKGVRAVRKLEMAFRLLRALLLD